MRPRVPNENGEHRHPQTGSTSLGSSNGPTIESKDRGVPGPCSAVRYRFPKALFCFPTAVRACSLHTNMCLPPLLSTTQTGGKIQTPGNRLQAGWPERSLKWMVSFWCRLWGSQKNKKTPQIHTQIPRRFQALAAGKPRITSHRPSSGFFAFFGKLTMGATRWFRRRSRVLPCLQQKWWRWQLMSDLQQLVFKKGKIRPCQGNYAFRSRAKMGLVHP